MAELFVGEITPVAFGFAPRGTALCNGQILAINQNQALFSLLGTTFGGDGVTNFALPDLRGRTIVHSNSQTGYPLGGTGGVESVSLSVAQLPAHSHAPGCNNGTGTTAEPANNIWAVSANGETLYQTGANPTGSMANGIIGMTGGGQGHSNLQPYFVINFIIALQGVYPTRN
jgi:microcystin-dependent protein